jgi:hypothetical protein
MNSTGKCNNGMKLNFKKGSKVKKLAYRRQPDETQI